MKEEIKRGNSEMNENEGKLKDAAKAVWRRNTGLNTYMGKIKF